jgi:hypothetical protein
MSMQMSFPNRVTFRDNFQPDGTIERVYSNGLREKRMIQAPGVVSWSDNRGNRGQDFYVGAGRVQRVEANGNISEGVQTGAGVIVWNNGQFIAVNDTPLPEPPLPPLPGKPGGFGGLLLGLGVGALYGYRKEGYGPYGVDPSSAEYALYAEEQARQQAIQRYQENGGYGDDYYFFYYYGYSTTPAPLSGDSGGATGSFDSGSDSFG